MTIHKVKCWPDYFEPIADGRKTFDLRLNDRGYNVGDTVIFEEYDDRKGVYTGHKVARRVGYMLEGTGGGGIAPLRGLARGYAILGLVAGPPLNSRDNPDDPRRAAPRKKGEDPIDSTRPSRR